MEPWQLQPPLFAQKGLMESQLTARRPLPSFDKGDYASHTSDTSLASSSTRSSFVSSTEALSQTTKQRRRSSAGSTAGDGSPKEIWDLLDSWPSPLDIHRSHIREQETAVADKSEECVALWSSRHSASPLSQRQRECLRVIFGIYAEKHLDVQSRPSRRVLSLSNDGWRCLCRDLLRVGCRGTPLLPLASLAKLFASVAAPRAIEPYTFLEAGLPPKLNELHYLGFPAFLGLLAEVAECWWPRARLIDLMSGAGRAQSKGEVRISPLAVLLNEIACCALSNPESERLLAARQYKNNGANKDGGMARLALWDLLSPRPQPGAKASAVPAKASAVPAKASAVPATPTTREAVGAAPRRDGATTRSKSFTSARQRRGGEGAR